MVETRIPLVLVLRLICDPAIVVRCAWGSRQRIALEKSQSRRVHSFPWNGTGWECNPRSRIEDAWQGARHCLGKNTLALKQGWHCGRANPANGLPASLIIGEEERPVANNWAAKDRAKLIASEKRLAGNGWRCRRKQVPGVESLITQKFKGGAVKVIRAGLRRQIDDAAVESAELGRRAVGFYFEFLDRVDDRHEGDLSGFRLQYRDAVKKKFVGTRPAAIDAGKSRAWRQSHTRRKGGE